MTTFSDAQDELAKIDRKIAQLEERLLRLRIRRNAIVPINQIPRELLREIMRNVRGDDDMADDEDEFKLEKLDQVCQHWRDVALDYPALWAKICLYPRFSIAWLRQLLKRSRSSPLSIKFCPGDEDLYNYIPEIIRVLVQERRRIVVLDVDETANAWGPTYFAQQLLTTAPPQWPLLESLRLILRNDDPMDNMSVVLPRLRSLTVDAYWNPNLLAPTLQYLHIEAIFPGFTLDKISRFLSLLPNLHSLELVNALEEINSIDWDSYTFGQGTIQVPALRTLVLNSQTSNTIAKFLSRMTLQDGVALRLHPQRRCDEFFIDRIVYKALQTKPASACIASAFNLGISGDRGVKFTLSTPRNNQICFEVDIPNADDELFRTIISRLPLQNLTSCSVQGRDWVEERLRILSTGRNLEVITINSSDIGFVKFFDAMAKYTPQCDVHQQTSHRRAERDDTYHPPLIGFYPCNECQELGKSFFPALRRIVLQEPEDWQTEGWYWMPSPEFFGRRIRCGRHIHEVFINDYIASGEVKSFRRVLTESCRNLAPSIEVRWIVVEDSDEESSEESDEESDEEGSSGQE